MSEQDQPFLTPGTMLPAFSLPGRDGMPHSPWDYKQREHLVIIALTNFLTNEARGVLKEFKHLYRALREEHCAVLAIATNPVIENLALQEELQLPFDLLTDSQGTVLARYTRWDVQSRTAKPGITLANRYSAVYEQWIADNEGELPSIQVLLEDLQYLNLLCTP